MGRRSKFLLALTAILLLQACGGGSGSESAAPEGPVLEIVSGSENKGLEPVVQEFAMSDLDDQARRELEASEETIALIERAFQAQHSKLLAAGFREFTIDRRVFEELLELDPTLRIGRTTPPSSRSKAFPRPSMQ